MSLPSASPGPARALVAGMVVALVLVAMAAVVLGSEDPGPMSAEEAVDFTERALAEAGVEAEVGAPTAGTFGLGPLAADVWIVPARVGAQPIALSVDADGDRALNLADELADGSNVLGDDEFDALAAFRFDPGGVVTDLPAGVAGGAVALAVAALAVCVRSRRVAVPAF